MTHRYVQCSGLTNDGAILEFVCRTSGERRAESAIESAMDRRDNGFCNACAISQAE